VKSVCTEGVSVEANPCMVRTDTRRIVWDAAKDLPNGFKCTNVLVTCRDARLFPEDKLYCVINLSDGSKEYLSGVPAGGWTDEHKTTKMVFRHVEAGSFMMGSPATEAYRDSSETYTLTTISSPFYIAVFELTEGQYLFGESVSKKAQLVPLYDVDGFLNQLKDKSGIQFSLPTEAQWEYACRGGSTTALYTGESSSTNALEKIARYSGNTQDGKGDSSMKTYTFVSCYQPNSIGLYDMIGNVRELCQDKVLKGGGAYYCVDYAPITDEIQMSADIGCCRAGWRGRAKEPVNMGGWRAYTCEGIRIVFPAE